MKPSEVSRRAHASPRMQVVVAVILEPPVDLIKRGSGFGHRHNKDLVALGGLHKRLTLAIPYLVGRCAEHSVKLRYAACRRVVSQVWGGPSSYSRSTRLGARIAPNRFATASDRTANERCLTSFKLPHLLPGANHAHDTVDRINTWSQLVEPMSQSSRISARRPGSRT